MLSNQVVVREVQGNRRAMVAGRLAEGVGQARHPADSHPHGEILSLHEGSERPLHVGYICDGRLLDGRHLRGRIATRTDWLGFVRFNHLSVIDARTELPLDGVHVQGGVVSRDLHAVPKARLKVGHERTCSDHVALPDAPGGDHLGIGVDGYEGPDIPGFGRVVPRADVSLLLSDERQDLVTLDVSQGQIAHEDIGKAGAAFPGAAQKGEDSRDADPGQAAGRTDGAAFHQGAQDCDLLFTREVVSHSAINVYINRSLVSTFLRGSHRSTSACPGIASASDRPTYPGWART
jgi:hypothetical protein